MVAKMMGPDARSARSLSDESGVSQPTLSRWLRSALAGETTMSSNTIGSEATISTPRRPAEWTALERLQIVAEASKLPDADLGAFLRSKGLHEASLEEWRETALAALQNRPKRSPEAKLVRELQEELRTKEKALAEMTALAVLKKKTRAIWGDEDDSTR